MTEIEIGTRVLHKRIGDLHAKVGYGEVTEIDKTKAKLRWEDSGKVDSVEFRDLSLAGEMQE
jgi:hypothetical protein